MPPVFIPPLLRELTAGKEQVEVAGKNVRQVIDCLEDQFPGVRQRLCSGSTLKPGLSVAVGSNVSSLGLLQKVDQDSEVHFLPAVGGG